MHRLTAIAVSVLLTLSATGQHRKSTVTLNDGSLISGTIISDSTDYLYIKVIKPRIIKIGRGQVSSIEEATFPIKKNLKTSGYYVRLNTSILSGTNESGNQGSMSFQLSNGFQFRNGIAVGIGSGMEELGTALLPFYADFRFTPLNTGLSPYTWIKTGYSFALSDQDRSYYGESSTDKRTDGGFLFNAGVGISMFTWNRTAVNVGIGYRYQKVTLNQSYYWWRGETVRHTITQYYRMEFHLGFVFM